MRVGKIFVVFFLLLLSSAAMTGCDEKKEVKTVDWYMAPENKAALDATLKECRNNPGQLKDDLNCLNAATARHNLFATKPSIQIK